MKIPPLAFILIGAIVMVTSLLLEGLLLFVIIGIGFILWGVAKLVFQKLQGAEPMPRQPQYTHHARRHCHYCRQPLHPHEHFCRRCGARTARVL